jgi:diaminopimelate epimerase
MHGLGNDFVLFDAREAPLTMTAALVRALGDRHSGIGFDQLILLSPSDAADVRMEIWNADGGSAEACGNASRCVVALTGARSIDTQGGVVKGSVEGAGIEVVMGEPRFDWNEIPISDAMDTRPLPMAWDELESPDAINVGNPHLCFFVEDSDVIPLETLGPRIEHDPLFPDRINVNVASVDADGSLKLRTWERGAGLTLACGTGACATGVAAIRRKLVSSPVTVRTRGGELTIAWAPGEPVRMRGPATHVFSGAIDLEAFA